MAQTSSINNFTYFLMSLRVPSLSLKAKEAIKVGLAFSLTFLITLKFGWLNPYWASFAVGQVALFANGQSLHNGVMRLVGLIPAITVSLFIFSVAAQDRWLFAILTSLWMMFATHMMIKDEKHFYLWNVAGFASLVILVTSFTSSADLFDNATMRVLDTTLGIVVYTLVTVFVWPETNIATLKQITIDLTSVHAKIFGLTCSQESSVEAKRSLNKAIKQEIQLQNALKKSFYAKGAETYEVQEAAEYWKEFHHLSTELSQSLNRLNNSFLGLGNIDIYKLVPKLDEYRAEVNGRFELGGDILHHGKRAFKVEPIILEVDESYLKSLRPFDQLAFASSKREFEKTQKLSQKILECANNIMDESVRKKAPSPKKQTSIYGHLVPDMDYLKRIFFIGSFTFICFCIWIFFDPPGHMKWLQLPPTVAMVVAATPQMKTNNMVVPAFFILSFFVLIYTVVMPRLSGAVELGTLLFLCMFSVFYFLDGVNKLMGVIAASTKLSVHNEQVYDFSAAANMVLLSLCAYSFIYVYSYVLSSPRPQRVFLNHLRRYFKSAHFLTLDIQNKTLVLISGEQNNNKRGILRKFKSAFYKHELRTLPLKIKTWSMAIDHKDFPENSSDDIEDLLIGIFSLSKSLEEWFASKHLYQTKHIMSETKEAFAKWNKGLESVFEGYGKKLDTPLSSQLEVAFKSHINTIEELINKHSKHIEQLNMSSQEKENIYRLVGSYQGLSLSLVSYAVVAEQMNWKDWEKEVFA